MDLMIPVPEDFVDKVVIFELRRVLDMHYDLDRDEGGELLEPDYQLINGLKEVLQYYMPYGVAEAFMQECALRELTMQAQLQGQYD